MKVLGILGSHQKEGINAQLMQQVLAGAKNDCQVDWLHLSDYQIRPDDGQANPDLDTLEKRLLDSDVWVVVAPTYWGTIAGEMKHFFDCMRPRLVAFNKHGEAIPDRFKGKSYISISSCYAGSVETFLTGVTDNSFKTIDKVLTAAGMLKIREIIQTNTWSIKTISTAKKMECQKVGQSIIKKAQRTDDTMKRYLQLFAMVALTSLITMLIQQLVGKLINLNTFIGTYVSFVVIFFALLAGMLHYFTVVKHRRH